jgi:hypothetical protein
VATGRRTDRAQAGGAASLATDEPVDPAARVTLHFHPDRLVGGVPILELMARAGRYETGTGNGG